MGVYGHGTQHIRWSLGLSSSQEPSVQLRILVPRYRLFSSSAQLDMPVSPNRLSSSVSSPHDILGSIEETLQRDGHKFRGRRCSSKKQKYPLTPTETNNPQPGLDADNGKEHQSSTRSPKYSRENYRLKSKRAKGKAREGTCPIDLAETKNRLAGSNRGFLSVESGECQDPLRAIIARKSA